MNTATVPVTIPPEAAARVAELGMQAEFEEMLEHTRQTIPGLSKVLVELSLPYDTADEIGVGIEAYTTIPRVQGDRTDQEWGTWQVLTFPPRVCEHFSFLLIHEAGHAG